MVGDGKPGFLLHGGFFSDAGVVDMFGEGVFEPRWGGGRQHEEAAMIGGVLKAITACCGVGLLACLGGGRQDAWRTRLGSVRSKTPSAPG